MKRVVFVLGSRSEWGYIKPIILKCGDFDINPVIFATNMTLVTSHGTLIKEIEEEGFHVAVKSLTAVDGDSHASMVKSMGLMMLSFTDFLTNDKPDWVVVAGDRAEQLAATVTSSYLYVPIGHIQAGERSGNIDGSARHAIARLAHLHFASNDDAVMRLVRSGEEQWRIHKTGAPQLDELHLLEDKSEERVLQKYKLWNSPFIIACVHPVTEEFSTSLMLIRLLMQVLSPIKERVVWVLPNNDAGGRGIRDYITQERRLGDLVFSNLTRKEYLVLLKNAQAIVGNSSSGLLEAPTFGTPCLNIGRRQKDRVRGANVVDSEVDLDQIVNGLNKVLNPRLKEVLKLEINPYGDGRSAERILNVLKKTEISEMLLRKSVTY